MIDRVRRHMRTVEPVLPSETGKRAGLAYSLWIPEKAPPRGGVVILHGAGSCKENHHDFARAALAAGFAAVAFDLRGHGASDGSMDDGVLEDVDAVAGLLRTAAGEDLPLALRGSSMGGYLAILAAPVTRASAVIAICPASAEDLRRGLEEDTLRFEADRPALVRLLGEHDLNEAVAALSIPLLLLHAEGDEVVPVQHSRELADVASAAGSRLITLRGGHHRSVQHDPELRAISLRFLERGLSGRLGR
jgi:alpha-beta hydrolase superfamily lysophospholipase